jgi:hypothetical protein
MLVTIIVHVQCKPFLDSQANDLGFASLMLNYLTLFAALYMKVRSLIPNSETNYDISETIIAHDVQHTEAHRIRKYASQCSL